MQRDFCSRTPGGSVARVLMSESVRDRAAAPAVRPKHSALSLRVDLNSSVLCRFVRLLHPQSSILVGR